MAMENTQSTLGSLTSGKRPVVKAQWEVFDTLTGDVKGKYVSHVAASHRVDALDAQYGAIRYSVRAIGERVNWSSVVARLQA